MSDSVEREDRVLTQFCERLTAIEGHTVRILSRPDRERPGLGGCEAVIERGGQRYAVEHKTVDSFPQQREDNDRFRKVIASAEQEVERAFPDSAIEIVVPIDSVPTGQRWEQLRTSFIADCKHVIHGLLFGERKEVTLSSLSLQVRISRHRKSGKALCMVMRFAPDDIVGQLESVLPDLVNKANIQLESYRRAGSATILLFDTDDFVLIQRPQVAEAFVRVAPRVNLDAIDQVFIAETYRSPLWIYPAKIGDRLYPDLLEYKQFIDTQYRLDYGETSPI